MVILLLNYLDGMFSAEWVLFTLTDCALSFPEAQFIPNKQLQPKETQIYIKLVKYAMQALDIYQVRKCPHPRFPSVENPCGMRDAGDVMEGVLKGPFGLSAVFVPPGLLLVCSVASL